MNEKKIEMENPGETVEEYKQALKEKAKWKRDKKMSKLSEKKQAAFDLVIEELAEYAERLKNEKDLTDQEMGDILAIVGQNYIEGGE
jgi:hypothetical protein